MDVTGTLVPFTETLGKGTTALRQHINDGSWPEGSREAVDQLAQALARLAGRSEVPVRIMMVLDRAWEPLTIAEMRSMLRATSRYLVRIANDKPLRLCSNQELLNRLRQLREVSVAVLAHHDAEVSAAKQRAAEAAVEREKQLQLA